MSKSKKTSKAKRPRAKPPMARPITTRTVVGRPETFPPGTAMDATGCPVFSLAVKRPHPRAAAAIARKMKRAEAKAAREAEQQEHARLVEIDQPLGDGTLDVKWAKGLMNHLPDDMREFIERRVEWLTREQVGWMVGMDDHWQEQEKVRAVLSMGVEVGFAMALARFREPLMRHAPAARKLIVRLDENRKRGTAATKAKPIKARSALRELIKKARREGHEVSVNEIMAALKCSRTTAWRRKTEIELEPRR